MHESIEELAKDPDKLEELPGNWRTHGRAFAGNLKTGSTAARKAAEEMIRRPAGHSGSCNRWAQEKWRSCGRIQRPPTVADVEKLARKGSCANCRASGKKRAEHSQGGETFKARPAAPVWMWRKPRRKGSSPHRTIWKGRGSITPAGSLRRGKETVGSRFAADPGGWLHGTKATSTLSPSTSLNYPRIDQVLAARRKQMSFTLDTAFRWDVRLLDKDSFAPRCFYFTGSREHNVTLRGRGTICIR